MKKPQHSSFRSRGSEFIRLWRILTSRQRRAGTVASVRDRLPEGFAALILIVVVGLVLAGVVGGAVYFGKKVSTGEETFDLPSKKLTELMTKGGPGGCKGGQECTQFCRQNIEECSKWCSENADVCDLVMGGGFQGQVAAPPKTQISFAKTFNMISGQISDEDIKKTKESK